MAHHLFVLTFTIKKKNKSKIKGVNVIKNLSDVPRTSHRLDTICKWFVQPHLDCVHIGYGHSNNDNF